MVNGSERSKYFEGMAISRKKKYSEGMTNFIQTKKVEAKYKRMVFESLDRVDLE